MKQLLSTIQRPLIWGLLIGTGFLMQHCTPDETDTLQPVEFTMMDTTRTMSCFETSTDTCMSVRLTYPVFTSASEDTLNMLITDFIYGDQKQGSSIEDILSDYEIGYREMQESFPDYNHQWYIERTVSLLLEQEGFISLELIDDSFTGGAHGLQTTNLRSYDRVGKTMLSSMGKFIMPKEFGQVRETFERYFRDAQGFSADESLNEEGFWFENDSFTMTNNFALTPEGIYMYYNSYEIASYADGTFEVEVPYSEILESIKPEFGERVERLMEPS